MTSFWGVCPCNDEMSLSRDWLRPNQEAAFCTVLSAGHMQGWKSFEPDASKLHQRNFTWIGELLWLGVSDTLHSSTRSCERLLLCHTGLLDSSCEFSGPWSSIRGGEQGGFSFVNVVQPRGTGTKVIYLDPFY